jgi:hypothetical protein
MSAIVFRVYAMPKSSQIDGGREISFAVLAPAQGEARYAVRRFQEECVRVNPKHFSIVVEPGELQETELPLLVTDGRYVNVLAADGSGEYVGLV